MNSRTCILITAAAILHMIVFTACGDNVHGERTLKVGSKQFTESVILGEIVSGVARDRGADVKYLRELGGTRVLWSALVKGDIDIYPEYTGTITEEILPGSGKSGVAGIREELSKYGVEMSPPLGFDNTYAIGMKEEKAQELGVEKISDLRDHPELRFGFTNEFMDRGDGWPGLKAAYGLPQGKVSGLNHDLAYRGLQSGGIDVTDLYSTDAEIDYYGLRVLEDDLGYFPEYRAVLLYRAGLTSEMPGAMEGIVDLGGKITAGEMIRMNEEVKIGGRTEGSVASAFLKENMSIDSKTVADSFLGRLYRNTLQHLFLVAVSLAGAIFISIPLGILAFGKRRLGQFILGTVGVIQTIPSLAVLVFMIPFFGIGTVPAIAALFLYSLLPIVRNTYTGLLSIPGDVSESAEALGLSRFAKLRLVEIPLASRSILAGIKTSAVINVGTATLGALIGAGGYGQPILTGIRLDDIGLILEGAVPAAVLALLVQWGFDLSERVLVPGGLRLKSGG